MAILISSSLSSSLHDLDLRTTRWSPLTRNRTRWRLLSTLEPHRRVLLINPPCSASYSNSLAVVVTSELSSMAIHLRLVPFSSSPRIMSHRRNLSSPESCLTIAIKLHWVRHKSSHRHLRLVCYIAASSLLIVCKPSEFTKMSVIDAESPHLGGDGDYLWYFTPKVAVLRDITMGQLGF
ncbi:hypothetical protein Bca4012_011194 [Brassica carinata]